jgi:hypothetical protein
MDVHGTPDDDRSARTARPRLRAPWADLRFVLGIVLIAASVAGVWLVISMSRQTAPVYAAARTIVPGHAIEPSDLRVVDVALGAGRDVYLTPGAPLAKDAVATRTVEAGELLPRSAVGTAADARATTIVVKSAQEVPGSLRVGTRVEVWSAPQTERGKFDAPRILVPEATVAAIASDDAVLGAAAGALELVIPHADVPDTLAALANGDAVSVVPIGSRR